MCTRYYLSSSNSKLKTIIQEVNLAPLTRRFAVDLVKPVKTEGEIRPTDVAPVIARNPKGEKTVFPMMWGYRNQYKSGSLILNARSETASSKPTFREDWVSHRCIIPASYYFEWEHIKGNDGKIVTGDKYAIQPEGEDVTWLCGLYRIENNFPVFVVLTREPGENISFIHDRMPLILPHNLIEDWIRPEVKAEELLKEAIVDVVAEKV